MSRDKLKMTKEVVAALALLRMSREELAAEVMAELSDAKTDYAPAASRRHECHF